MKEPNLPEAPQVALLFIQRPLFRLSFSGINPLGLMYVAANLAGHGYTPWVFSGTLLDARDLLQDRAPDGLVAVGFYCDYENVTAVATLSRWVRDTLDIPTLVGGPQAEFLEGGFFQQSGIAAAARGEGEQTAVELLNCLVRNQGYLSDINGITYLDESGILHRTPDRPPIKNLDALPLQNVRHAVRPAPDNVSVLTGRGCPFHCAFCYAGAAGRRVRLRSVERVMQEIRQALEATPECRYVWFADDTFTLSRQRMVSFCDALAALRQERDVVWFCEAHPNALLNMPDMLPRMVEAGMVRMQIGIETGSPKVSAAYDKRASLDQIREVVVRSREAGLVQLCGNIIIGGAWETPETIEETKAFVQELLELMPGQLDVSQTLFMPYPETPMRLQPAEYGIELVDPEALTTISDYAVIRTEALDCSAITKAYRDFMSWLFARMNALLANGSVTHEAILAHYQLHERYGLSSIWKRMIYKRNTLLDRRYQLLATTEAHCFTDCTDLELPEQRPLRTFNLWNGLTWVESLPTVLGYVLAPLEYDLLLFCTGKLTIREVVASLYPTYGVHYGTTAELLETVLRLLRGFESRHWIVLTPY